MQYTGKGVKPFLRMSFTRKVMVKMAANTRRTPKLNMMKELKPSFCTIFFTAYRPKQLAQRLTTPSQMAYLQSMVSPMANCTKAWEEEKRTRELEIGATITADAYYTNKNIL